MAGAGTAKVKIGDVEVESYSSKGLPADEAKKKDAEFKKAVTDALKAAGYPPKADPAKGVAEQNSSPRTRVERPSASSLSFNRVSFFSAATQRSAPLGQLRRKPGVNFGRPMSQRDQPWPHNE